MQAILSSSLDRLARVLVVCVLLIGATGVPAAQATGARQPAPTPIETPTGTPTATNIPTDTSTPAPTEIPLSPAATTDIPTETPTDTATATETATATSTATDTATPASSSIPVATATATAPGTTTPTGGPDLTFGGDGIVTTNVDAANDSADYPRAVLVQPDGQIVVVGWYTAADGNNDYVVARYSKEGTLDASFGADGLVTTDLGSSLDYAWDAELQPDGKIVLAGYTSNGKNTDFALVRYNRDGGLDPTFGSKGVVTTDLGGLDDYALASAIQADGKIILVGAEWDPVANAGYGHRRFVLVRYNPDGNLDPTFDGDGKVLGDAWGLNTYLADVAVQADGKVVAVGAIENPVTHFNEFAVARYNADGSADRTFGGKGLVTTDLAEGTWDDAAAVVLQPDNKIVVAGAAFGPEGSQCALARYTPDGSRDVVFGSDGKVVASLGEGYSCANALALQADGKLLVAGWRELGDEADSVIARYKPDGMLDETFGDRGLVVTQDGDVIPDVSRPPSDYATAMALQPDGRIVVAEEAGNILVARYLDVSVLPASAVGSPIIGAQTAAERQPVPGLRAASARNPIIGVQLAAERQPASTPTDIPTATDALTDIPTDTATAAATPSATLDASATASETPTDTPLPILMATTVETNAITATTIFTDTATPMASATPTPSPSSSTTPPATPTAGASPTLGSTSAGATWSSAAVMFIENAGQFDPDVRFQVQGANTILALTDDGLRLTLFDNWSFKELSTRRSLPSQSLNEQRKNRPSQSANLRLSFIGANPHPRLEPFNRISTHVSFLKGNDPKKWHTDISAWGGVRYVDLYPGIDLELTSHNGQWVWRMVRREGAPSPGREVRVRVDGATTLNSDADRLRLGTSIGTFILPLPQVEGAPGARPIINGNEIIIPVSLSPEGTQHWRAPSLLRSVSLTTVSGTRLALTNDQSDLSYEVSLGGFGSGIALDASRAAYITGYSGQDAFVTKLDAAGNVVYSVFLGGGGNWNEGDDVAVDADGAAYVTGSTNSEDFPIVGGFQSTCGDLPLYSTCYGDAFVTKLNTTGGIAYSTYLGGEQWDAGQSIAVDSEGQASVTGYTESLYFPIHQAFQAECHRWGPGFADFCREAFVTKLNANGSGLVYSTYFGGAYDDWAYGIAADADGAVYVTGYTDSRQCFDCSVYQEDAFVTKLDASGGQAYSQLISGSGFRTGYGIAVDATGAAYVIGDDIRYDNIAGRWLIPGTFFVTKLDASGSQAYSVSLGSSGIDSPHWWSAAIAVDADGSAYTTGDTYGNGGFVAKLDTDGYTQYFFPYEHPAYGIVVDSGEAVYITGDGYAAKLAGPDILDKMVLSRGRPRNGSGDPRECPITTCNQTQGYTGDPINSRTGGFDLSVVDLSIPTVAGQLVFQRTYASPVTNTYTTTLGYGWTHNQDTRLIFPTDPGGQPGVVWFKAHSANQYRFDIITDTTTTYVPFPGVLAALTESTVLTTTYMLTNSQQAVYNFDYAGRLTKWTDPQGHTLVYTYTNSLLTEIAEPLSGRSLTLEYNSGQTGRLSVVRDHTGRRVTFGYDLTTGDLITVTDVLSQTWTYVYTGTTHLLTDIRDPRGITIVQTDYDAQGRAWKQTNSLNQVVTQITYDANNTATVMDGRGITETHTYDGRNTLTNDAAPLGSTITKTYDLNFRPAVVLDPLSHPTTMTWSADGANLTQLTDALSQTTQLSYDQFNNLTRVVDARGLATTYTYSGTLMTTNTDALSNTTRYTYTTAADAPQPPNLIKAMTDALGRTTLYQYDTLGQRIVMTDAAGIVTTFGYDTLGRVITTTTAAGTAQQQITVNQYDAAGRMIQTTRNYTSTGGLDPNQYNLITQYAYDAVGNQTLITDTLSHVTRTEYDMLNRPVTVTTNYVDGNFNPARPDEDIPTVTQYDENGNVITTTEYAGITGLERKTYTQYDALNRPVTVTVNYKNGVFDAEKPDEDIQSVTGYDANGNVITTTQAANSSGLARSTYTQYDALNRPITVTVNYKDGVFDSAKPDEDIPTVTQCDENGNVVFTIQYAGITGLERKTYTQYDNLNRPVTVTVNYVNGIFDSAKPDEDIPTVTQYDANGNVVTTTQFYGITGLERKTYTQYDNLNRPVTVTVNYVDGSFDPAKPDEDIQTVTQYDTSGNVITTTQFANIASLARKTYTQYDSLNRPITVTTNYVDSVFNPAKPDEDIRTVTQYDALGNVLTTTQFANVPTLARTTYNQYDALNRPITVTANYAGTGAFDPNAPDRNLIQITTFNAAGSRTAVTELRGGPGLGTTPITTTFTYDGLSRLITTTMPLTGTAVASTAVTYDGLGRVVDSLDPLGQKTRTQYDALDRPITVTVNYKNGVFDPTKPDEDLMTVYTYDAASNRVQVKDPKGIVTKFEYDLLNRLKAVEENYVSGEPRDNQTNVRTEYTYDAAGNRKTIKDGRSNITSFTYDLLNRLLTATDPLTNTTQYAYNAVGDVITMTDALTRNTISTYDLLNRLTKIDYPAPDADVLFTYDGAGQRTVMTDSVGVTTWAYDLVGRPLTITQPFTGSVIYTYDSAGNRLSLKYPDGKVVTDTYDLASRLVQVKDWQTQLTRYAYDSASRLTSLALPNGITSTYTYDGANRLTALAHQTLTQTVASYTYTLDAVGNRVQVVESGPQATPPPSGTIITVTTTADDLTNNGNCSLREALRAANLNQAIDACPAGGSVDTVIVPSGTYTLTRNGSDDTGINGDLDITDTVTLTGAGAATTIIQSGISSRLFEVFTATVQISGVTIRNGNVGSGSGGGMNIKAGGKVTLTNVAVVSNTTTNTGGGIYSTGALTLTASAVLSNTSTGASAIGGGITNASGTLTLINVTLSGNAAGGDGGGLRNFSSGTATLNNVTVTNNTADSDGDGVGNGGGISRGSGTVSFKNTLIAGNVDNSPSTKQPDCSGTMTSQGYNLVGDDTGCTFTTQTGDQRGTSGNPINPQLGPLANNGGPTLTHAPQTGSPAIDKGNPAAPGSGGNACAANDQRNYARPVDGDSNGSVLCDTGAYEVGATPAISGTTTTITYTYDPLYRLTAANYSTGNAFGYALDAVGNTLTRTQTLAGQLVTTTYTYNAANALVTAKDSNDPTTWYYTYDANGRLTDITPNGTAPANGARRFTYSVAGYLIQTETYTNTTYQLQAQMQYNALGERQTMTAWQSGISLTTQYVLDVASNGRILAATANAQTTFYLYDARSPLAELTSSWSYYLRDGVHSVRQVSDPAGAVTLERSYTPWGEVLTQSGTGNFVWGYFGGLTDAVTGLIYVGGGQYYDPATGRFLTRVVPFNPLRPRNPYVPTNDPVGALLGPMVLLAFLARRRKNGKYDPVLLVLVVLVAASLACETPGPAPAPSPETNPPPSVPPVSSTTPAPPLTRPTRTPTPTPTPSPSLTPTVTPCPTATPQWLDGDFTITHYTFALEADPIYANDARVSANGLPPDRLYRDGFLFGARGILLQGTGLAEDGNYITIDWNRGGPNGRDTYFTYGIGGRYGNPVAWETAATGDPRLPAGTRIAVEIYPGRVFTINDTGGGVGANHIDIFVGAITIAEADQLGTRTSRVGILP